ncbi:MAG TPA: peptide chain release factor-like protein [Nitrospirae bacterium]|nr:peptide chain release factor 1 [bacterium BMS3Abin10]GBE38437.1 peptide chain release factor 1 [bacterium BMS3Bbin08]HDH00269.1 peptide chain release factor-like protein [Nitrospirota bacterium]HDH50774.1 peptide chain release factor-like protein [Nitrospirota bacterium]HDK81930.1 peptide chain release factor-like protein [Nitrospirota bacterium]
MFAVSPEKEKALKAKLSSLGIYEKDIRESFIRSRGRGGQNVNKTSTCVYLKHRPTGIEVKCRKTRSQGLNRYHARLLLYTKIERLIKGKKSEEEQRLAKLRRQKRKRSKRAKEKMLAEKKLHSKKKKERSLKVSAEE